MSQQILTPTDEAIERGLASRAPRRPDASLLDAVMTGVHASGQVSRRGWMFRNPAGGVRRPLVWAGIAAALLIAGTLAISGGSQLAVVPPPVPTLPPASLPAAIAPPSNPSDPSPSASPLTCATDTTSILTGDGMPPTSFQPMTVDPEVLKVGVYVTAPADGEYGVQHDIWAITSGTAIRIASIVGPDFNLAGIDDVSRDGRAASVSIAERHVSTAGPECSDLYALQTDGSGVTRLTFNGPGANAWDGAFSADGRYVSFVSAETGATSPGIGLVDLEGGATETDIPCDAMPGDLHLAWSPTDDRLAAICRGNLMVVAVGGSPAQVVGAADEYAIPTQRPVDDQAFIGFGWRDPERILVVTATGGQRSNGPFNLTTLTLGDGAPAQDATWSPTVTSHPWLSEGGLSTGIRIAPDGKTVAIYGDPVQDDPQDDTLALYAMDATSGVAQRVAGWGASAVAWSSDSRSLMYIDYVDDSQYALTVYDLATKTGTRSGSMPFEYRGGIWRAQ